MGVDLFFVLSGFLISGLLFTNLKRNGRISIGRFLIRRGLKIWPSYYVFLALTAFLVPDLAHRGPIHLFFLQNYITPGAGKHAWSHLWSLAVEEHFYLVLPFLMVVLVRFRALKAIPAISIVLVIFCLYARTTIARDFTLAITPTHLRMDSLFAGVALGYFFHFERHEFTIRRGRIALAGSILLLIPSFILLQPNLVSVSFQLVAFCLMTVWAASVAEKQARWFLSRWIAAIGRYSYSIYLWHHAVVFAIFWTFFPTPTVLTFTVYLTLSLTLGIGMSKLIEMPVLRLRDRVFPSVHVPVESLSYT